MADNFLIQEPNGEWRSIRAIDVGDGVLVPVVGGATSSGPPGVRTGTRIGPDMRALAAATTAVAAATIYGHPVWVPERAPFSGMALCCGTAVAGVSGKMALYAGGAGGENGALIEESATILNMNSSANTELVAAFSTPRTLSQGWYWPMCKFDGAAQPNTVQAGGLMGNGAVLMYGAPSIGPFVRAIGGSLVTTRATVADTYADPFPSLPVLALGTGTPGVPIMVLVAA